jgi:hypothetical protein
MATHLINRSIVIDSSINSIYNNITSNYYNKLYIDTSFNRKSQFDSSYSNIYKKNRNRPNVTELL